MPLVRIIKDPFDPNTYSETDTLDVLGLLAKEFPSWPVTARLYKGQVSELNDVTPTTEQQIQDIKDAGPDDLFYVIVYPGTPIVALIIAVVVIVLLTVALLFLMPKIPTIDNQDQSANNTLGQRANKARPNSRIEDIYGEVVSIHTLLTVPLVVYEDNVQVEYTFMSVGRGAYTVTDVKDGDTPINQIAGAGVRYYGPDTSPNSGSPFLASGASITQPLLNVLKSNDINGQALRAPNANAVHGTGTIRFVAPDTIEANNADLGSSSIDFTNYFDVGDDLTVQNADFGGSVTVFNATTQNARFYPDYRIEFQTFDPSTLYVAGQTLVISNAGFAGVDGSGNVVYVDVSGSYVIDSVNGTTKIITLVAP